MNATARRPDSHIMEELMTVHKAYEIPASDLEDLYDLVVMIYVSIGERKNAPIFA